MSTAQKYMNDYSLFMQKISSPLDKPTQVCQYPDDPMYMYLTQLEKINLDIEREQDILNNRGFICSAARGIKKDLKDPNGIFSSKFGQTLGDQNPFIDRYKCECGRLHSRINNGLYCGYCGTRVRYMDDDFGYFGWLVLDEHQIIHPILYMQIEFLCGSGAGKHSKLDNILNVQGTKDRDGKVEELQDKPKNEPFYGIGMIDFVERFDEIMAYYVKMYPSKREYYDQIMQDRDKVFTHSIPVFTTHLRPFQVTGRSMQYEGTNGIYNMMNAIVHSVNKNKTRFDRNKEQKNQNLYKLQM
jgi:hypothetical protein